MSNADPNLLWDIRERMHTSGRVDYELYRRAYEEIKALRDQLVSIERINNSLPAWCFQPEPDTPGLFIQCRTMAERETVIRALKEKGDD